MFVFSKTANTEYSHPIIGNLLSTKENNICFDCEKNNPSFISLNNSISKILSIFIDKISNNEIKFIEKGGNRRLNELLNLYSLDKKKINRIILYCSNLLEFHRNAIKSEVYNIKCPIMISQEQILKPCENLSDELINEINEINKIVKPIKKKNKMNGISKVFEESDIIEKNEYNMIIEAIESRLQKDIEEIKLLYKASVDGGEPIIFHQRCDGKSNTLILIKSNENKRFGGFTSATWDSTSEIIYKDDINSFLFSLDKQNIYPIKNFNCAICCKDSFGPIFGCFPSISITGNPLKNNKLCVNETNDLSSYDFLDDNNFFLDDGGDDCISANEYEVFQISF